MSVSVVVGGLPATGKSTVASVLARRIKAPYLRVDRIEQAIVDWSSLTHPVGPVGYAVAHQLAAEQLALGLDVVVECVNAVELTRDSWAETARSRSSPILEIELICSDAGEHKRRWNRECRTSRAWSSPAGTTCCAASTSRGADHIWFWTRRPYRSETLWNR